MSVVLYAQAADLPRTTGALYAARAILGDLSKHSGKESRAAAYNLSVEGQPQCERERGIALFTLMDAIAFDTKNRL